MDSKMGAEKTGFRSFYGYSQKKEKVEQRRHCKTPSQFYENPLLKHTQLIKVVAFFKQTLEPSSIMIFFDIVTSTGVLSSTGRLSITR